MICPKCGSELFGSVSECPYCGASVSESDVKKQQRASNPYKKLFVDSNEKLIATIGEEYASSIIRGNGISDGYGILTDKRCYFMATCYSTMGSTFTKTKDQWTIDLQDITASGFRYSSNIMHLILSIISAFLCFFSLMFINEESSLAFTIITAVISIVFFVAYILSKSTFYAVYFAGGGLSIDIASFSGVGDIDYFDKQLRIAKNGIVDNYHK